MATLLRHKKVASVFATLLIGGMLAIAAFNPAAQAAKVHHARTFAPSVVTGARGISAPASRVFLRRAIRRHARRAAIRAAVPSLPFTGADPRPAAASTN